MEGPINEDKTSNCLLQLEENTSGLEPSNMVIKENAYFSDIVVNYPQDSDSQILYLPLYNVNFDDLQGPVVLRLEDALQDSLIFSFENEKLNEASSIDPLQLALNSIENKDIGKIEPAVKDINSIDLSAVEDKYNLIDTIIPRKVKSKNGESRTVSISNTEVLTCDICAKSFEKPNQLFGHYQCHKNELCLPCKVCAETFDSHSKLIKHEKAEHNLYLIKCPNCPKTYLQKVNLVNHIKKDHFGERKHMCKFCNKGFFKETDLKLHIQIHFGLSNSICETCGMKFSNISNLNRHRRIHTGVKPYVCKVCGKRFTQVNALEFHMGTHSTTKKFKCKLCPKECKNIIAIKRHMKEQHSMSRTEISEMFKDYKKRIRQYYCKICGDSFQFASYLSNHEKKVHSNQSEYLCHHCEKTFLSMEEIKSHACEPPEDNKAKPINNESVNQSNNVITGFELSTSTDENKEVNSNFELQCIGFISEKGDCFYLDGSIPEIQNVVSNSDNDASGLFAPCASEHDVNNGVKSLCSVPVEVSESDSLDSLLPFPKMSEADIQSLTNGAVETDSIHSISDKTSSFSTIQFDGVNFQIGINDNNQEKIVKNSGDNSSIPSSSNSDNTESMDNVSKIADESKSESKTVSKNHVNVLLNKYLKENKTHDGFKCSICGKEFSKKCNLRQHLGIHDVMFQSNECDICGKTFAWKSTLNKHKIFHSNVIPVNELCQYCGKKYKHYQDLIKHIKNIHNKERPHKCSECDKTFFRSYDLKIHMRTHTKEKPYVCRICGFKFTHVSQLIRHERKHTGEKPYKCPICSKSFAQSGSWHYHLKSKHKAGGDIKLSHGSSKKDDNFVADDLLKELKGDQVETDDKLVSYLTETTECFSDSNQIEKLFYSDT